MSEETTMRPVAAVLNNKVSRRGFFARTAGIAGAGIVLAACGSSAKTGSSGTATTTAAGGSAGSGDAKVAAVAAGLEVLAVGTYKAALDAASAGKLGTVPPAVAEFVKKAMADHQAHLDAWNKVLTTAGQPAVSEPNAMLKPTVDAAFAKVTDAAGAANLALMLEQIAAQTYLKVMPTLASKDAVKLAGSVQIIDRQHQAILLYALGQYPVPDVFQGTDKAAA